MQKSGSFFHSVGSYFTTGRKRGPNREVPADRGIALVVTLLLLLLLSVLGLAAVLSGSSDLLINNYYANYRASFYAADSGLNIARQAMQAQLAAAYPTTFSTPPIASPATLSSTVQTYVTTNYGSSGSPYALNAGGAANSLSEKFYISSVSVSAATGYPTTTVVNGATTAYKYIYNYSMTAIGSATGYEQATITENGAIIVTDSTTAEQSANVAFSAFGAFINNFPACNGPLVYGTLSGPMYANGQWNFGASGSYTFTDPVDQTGADFSYWTSGSNCTQSATVPYKSGSTTISPTFESGYNLNQPAIALPANDYSQRWAVLDGVGCGEHGTTCGVPSSLPPEPTNTEMNAVLKDINQNPYPVAGATSGVYIPYTCTSGTCSVNANGGGIYVEGGSSVTSTVTLSTANGSGGSSNPSAQVIQVAQTFGSTTASPVVTETSGPSCTYSNSTHKYTCTASYQQTTTTTTPTTFTTVTTDPVGNSTTVSAYTQNANSTLTQIANNIQCTGSSTCNPSPSFSGGSTSNSSTNGSTTTDSLTGVFENETNTPFQPATMVYVDDNVNITGPSSGASIQNNSMVTVTANGNITQTGNLTYATEPVTTTQNQIVNSTCCNGDPIDTLIPANQNMNQVLGLFTANGQFQLQAPSNNANMETDASIAMVSSSPTGNNGKFATVGSYGVGTWTNIGGRAENSINGVSINTSNVFFDRRFTSRTNFEPPWFPETTVTMGEIVNSNGATVIITPQRVQWVAATGGQ
jgi:Tfp pilus assembly protein PilX